MQNTPSHQESEKRPRPLSPHLQVYRPQLTSVLSILHRMTGIVLSIGLAYSVFWLYSLKQGDANYAFFHEFSSLWIVKIFLLSWIISLFYHFFNGIRHLFWDMGWGFELQDVYRSGYLVLGLTILCSLLFLGVLR